MHGGIKNWEVDSKNNQAIGGGAGTAGMKEESFVDFSKRLFGEDLVKLKELRKGDQQTAQPQTQPPSKAQSESAGQAESAAS